MIIGWLKSFVIVHYEIWDEISLSSSQGSGKISANWLVKSVFTTLMGHFLPSK